MACSVAESKKTATPTPQPTRSPTLNQLPIVVDFGVGTNVKEIQAILSARPNHKLIVIEDGDDQMRLLGLMLQPLNISSDRLEVISGDYSDPNILNGRKADEAFRIYPNPDARNKVAPAAHNHLQSGGKFYKLTELRLSYQEIYGGLSMFTNFDDKWTRTVDKGGVPRTEIEAGRNGPTYRSPHFTE